MPVSPLVDRGESLKLSGVLSQVAGDEALDHLRHVHDAARGMQSARLPCLGVKRLEIVLERHDFAVCIRGEVLDRPVTTGLDGSDSAGVGLCATERHGLALIAADD